MMRLLFVLGVCMLVQPLHAQTSADSTTLRRFYDTALAQGRSMEMLTELCTEAPARLSGSANAAKAVAWGERTMRSLGFERVWLQEVMVPHWVRGAAEQCRIVGQKQPLDVLALGNTVGTGPKGVEAEVVEVQQLSELERLGEAGIRGKIVFFNRPMEPRNIETFTSYGLAGDQRRAGPSAAAKYGAVAVLVRSLTLSEDSDMPHTGSTRYDTTVSKTKIAAAALSTRSANRLSAALKGNPKLKVFLRTNCEMLPDVLSHNVIGEIKGSEKPDEIVLVGGHLDSWDPAQGAHDDGAGCVQSIEALRLFNVLGIKPKRTIRAVLFMNEENGLRGGLKYAEVAKANNERHIAAIESDAGGFVPRGFGIGGTTAQQDVILRWASLFRPYYADHWVRGGGGADIGPLAPSGTITIGLRPDSQRYFTIHHNRNDNLDQVNPRELALGAATMAGLLWLLSEYGVN